MSEVLHPLVSRGKSQRCRVSGCRKKTSRIYAVSGFWFRLCKEHRRKPVTLEIVKPVSDSRSP